MSKIAIFFPGMGYQHDKPLLYFSKDIAVEKGYENYIDVKYTHTGEKIRGDAEKMNAAFENMYQQAEQYLADINWNEYDDVLFVSKSIGTIIASEYARKHSIKNIRHILYTPLTYTFKHEPQNAIGFIGTKDGWCNADDVVELAKERDILIYTYEDCNHSLECEDTIKNIDILSDIMKKTKDYLEKTNIDYLRSYFCDDKTSINIEYRRKYGEEFKQVAMEMITADDYEPNNQTLYLYVKAVDK